MSAPAIGVVGGSGLYEIEGLTQARELRLETPFGAPSDAYVVGELAGRRAVFLPRHGRGHRLLPGEINYRANVHGFKQLGVRWLVSVSAVGSMREQIAPGELVIVDQFIDRTQGRAGSFFGEGVVGHVQFADPICGGLAAVLAAAAEQSGAVVHRGGTYLCIEGPQFSTRAESRLYRQWGVDVIGMTNLPEARLAREAGICYATLAMATDYDCWHEGHEDVSVQAVLAVMAGNVQRARGILAATIRTVDLGGACPHAEAGRRAVVSSPEGLDPRSRSRLDVILGESIASENRPQAEGPAK
ncbi:MAG: S-methyl-5'-thioadenosine phosphorylase [Proteobacteria bacterium]|nr:S-methyl-5'-thioadenosine phosphorylase [Pseudomonadota bacterium]